MRFLVLTNMGPWRDGVKERMKDLWSFGLLWSLGENSGHLQRAMLVEAHHVGSEHSCHSRVPLSQHVRGMPGSQMFG